jgi:hypothetical protein
MKSIGKLAGHVARTIEKRRVPNASFKFWKAFTIQDETLAYSEEDIKLDMKEIKCLNVDGINLAHDGSSDGLFRTR